MSRQVVRALQLRTSRGGICTNSPDRVRRKLQLAECDPGSSRRFSLSWTSSTCSPRACKPLFDVVAYNRALPFLFTDMDFIPPDERKLRGAVHRLRPAQPLPRR
ncbi:hypothetical protein LV779_36755 [Streptomyces thinghirensis]|nr:hypothetical protein [Streptomyces thinghirensis]